MKAIKQSYPVVGSVCSPLRTCGSCIESVDEILKCDHSNYSFALPFYVVMLIMLCKVVLAFETVGAILKCDHSNFSFALCFYVVMLFLFHKVVLSFDSVDEILKCDHSNYSFCSVVLCSNVDYAVQSGSYI